MGPCRGGVVSVGLDRLGFFESVASDGFAGWLAECEVSLVLARQAELVLVGRTPAGELRVDVVDGPPVGALATDARSLWMVTNYQVWRFEDGLEAGTLTDSGNDAFLLPQVGATIGGLQASDIGLAADGSPVLASHRFSCLVTLADGLSFEPLWLPRWVTRLVPEERSPISGLAIRDGQPGVVTLLGCTDEPDLWRSERAAGGAIVDVGTDEVVAGGLSMPSHPRWHEGRLWFTQAGTGELCVVEDDDTVTVVARLDTFVRALNFVGPYAVVAGSGSRSISLIEGLPIGDRLIAADRRPEQGVFVIDTRTGEVVHRLTIEGTGREVPAMAVLPGVRRAALIAPADQELQITVAYDRSWDPASARPSG